jgi:hypothetical protein
MTDHALSRDELARWTPAALAEFRRRFPRSYMTLKYRMGLAELSASKKPSAKPRRLAAIRFDRNRHHEIMRKTLLSRERLRMGYKRPLPRLMVSDIVAVCARAGNITVAELIGPRRRKAIMPWRHVAAYIAAVHCAAHLGLPTIGRLMGGKDHSTIMHSRNIVSADLANGAERFGEIVAAVETRLGLR